MLFYLELANGQGEKSGNFPLVASGPTQLGKINLALVLVEIYCPCAVRHPD